VRAVRGFTLVELLVAVLISTIVFALGYGAIDQALANRETLQRNAVALTSLQNAIRLLVQDCSQLAPRPVRDPLGAGHLPALQSDGVQMTLTRGGFMNAAGIQRSTLQRVRYVMEEGNLYRDQWLVLDATLEPLPVRKRVMENVKSFSVRFMDNVKGWQASWPPPSPIQQDPRWRPTAVEVTIETEDWGKVLRLIEVPG
jgi:general secretion pathway protein J